MLLFTFHIPFFNPYNPYSIVPLSIFLVSIPRNSLYLCLCNVANVSVNVPSFYKCSSFVEKSSFLSAECLRHVCIPIKWETLSTAEPATTKTHITCNKTQIKKTVTFSTAWNAHNNFKILIKRSIIIQTFQCKYALLSNPINILLLIYIYTSNIYCKIYKTPLCDKLLYLLHGAIFYR